MRCTREGSRTSTFGSSRSCRVIDWIMASMRTSSLSSKFAAAPGGIIPPRPGIFSIRSLSEPIFWMVRT